MKQIKVLKINQNNLLGSTVCSITDDSFSKQGTYNFLVKILELYRQKEFEDDEKVTEFIKLTLSADEDKAREQWFNGVIWEGRLYKGWFASVGGMKQEDSKSKGKCEVYFVDENVEEFKNYFETIISLGKFNRLDKEEDRYVNKEILSRFSLATSDLMTEIDMPNIIILPTAQLDWKRTYKTVLPKTTTYINEDGEVIEGIDYDLIDYEFDTDKRDEDGKQIDKMEAFDGGGIATPKVMNDIGTTLKRDDIDFAIIRGYGIGIKGLVTRFNILKYLEIMHKKIGDTDYCYKKEGKFYLLDMYGNFREVTDNTLLLNESMVKLADKFDNMDDYYTQLNKVNTDEHRAVYDVINKLYITKVNKKNEEVDEYRRLSYQFFNALALTKSEYYELAKEDFRLYKKLLKPYKKGTDHSGFTECLDTINIFYNLMAKEDELDNIKDVTNVVDKCNALLMLNKKYVRLPYVKKNLAKNIEKKIREMASGKITLKSSYNYIAVDPISYMNFAMTRSQGDNGLKQDEFYCSNIKNSETRTIFRNPLMAYSEVHNIKFIKNDFLDNLLCKSNEIVYFNNKSDILNLIGSADLDGDCVNMVNNEIVKNAVVIPKDNKYFCFTADGKKVKSKFNDEGRFLATYKPSGNLIGQVAIMGVNVNNKSQTVKLYYAPNKNKFYTFSEIKNMYIALDESIKDITDDKLRELIEQNIDVGNLVYTDSLDNDFLREKIKEQFYENEKDIYNLLYCSSLVIDSPKTMNIIDVDKYTRIVKDKYSQSTKNGKMFKKANFLQYKESYYDVNSYMYRGVFNSPLDKLGQKVSNELLQIIKTRKYSFGDKPEILQRNLEIIEDKYFNQELFNYLTDICSDYCRKWDKAKNLTKEDRSKKMNEIETEYTLIANKLMNKYDLLTIGKALSKIEDCRERFIICFFFPCLNAVDKLNPSVKNFYELDENGEIDYMYKKYRRLEKTVNLSDAAIEKLSIKDMVRLKQLVELRFKSDNVEEITTEIYEGLEKDGYYDLDVNDGIEIFPEFKKALDGRNTVRVKCFMKKKDGTDSISKSGFGIVIDK